MKKVLQKLGLTFVLAAIFCIAFVICASAETFKVEYRNDLYGYSTGHLKDATWTDTTDENGEITLRSDKITEDSSYTFFGWFTVEGDVYYPGQTITLTKDIQLFEAYGVEVGSATEIRNNMNKGIYLRLTQDISTDNLNSTFNGILDFNNHNLTLTGAQNGGQVFGNQDSRFVFVGKGTLTHKVSADNAFTFYGNMYNKSYDNFEDPDFRLWIGKDVTIDVSQALVKYNGFHERLLQSSILIYGTVNAKYLARGFFCNDGEVTLPNGQIRYYYAAIEIFETAKITLTGEKFVLLQNETATWDEFDVKKYMTENATGDYSHPVQEYVKIIIHGGTFILPNASANEDYWYELLQYKHKWNYNFSEGATFNIKFPDSVLGDGYEWENKDGSWVVIKKCTNPDGHEYENIVEMVYNDGFFAVGYKKVACVYCGKQIIVESEAIFVAKGYSIAQDGSAIMGGYKVNYELVIAYEKANNVYLEYGVIFVNVDAVDEISFNDNGIITSANAIQAKISSHTDDTGAPYEAFNYKVSGFKPNDTEKNYADLNIVISAYVIEREKAEEVGTGAVISISFVQSQYESIQEKASILNDVEIGDVNTVFKYQKSVKVTGAKVKDGTTLGAVTLRSLYLNSDFKDSYGQYFEA